MKLLLCSHGKMASGIASSLSIIVGDLAEVDAIDAYIDETPFETQLENYLKETDSLPDLILTDLYGGSVNQKCAGHKLLGTLPIISGMSLPLALQASLQSAEEFNENSLKELIQSSQEELKQVIINTDEDDFDF